MNIISRNDNTIFGIWWWTIDRYALFGFLLLAFFGIVTTVTSSATFDFGSHTNSTFMMIKQTSIVIVSIILMITISFLSRENIRRLGVMLFILSLILVALTHVIGNETKGATRWLSFMGVSFQPTEILKPGFAVFIAWMFQASILKEGIPGYRIALAAYFVTIALVITQPDLGQSVVITMILAAAIFLSGIPIITVLGIAIFGLLGLISSYFLLDHVRQRIDGFMYANPEEITQTYSALRAFTSGGFFGKGPGQGVYKNMIPDGQTDFIFAVIGEEYGLIGCMVLVTLIVTLILRKVYTIFKLQNLFAQMAATGLLVQFSIQILINMATSLNLIPPKGMTFPFISFGGSSTLATGIAIGMLLALTRLERK